MKADTSTTDPEQYTFEPVQLQLILYFINKVNAAVLEHVRHLIPMCMFVYLQKQIKTSLSICLFFYQSCHCIVFSRIYTI